MVLYIFNPDTDLALANGKGNYTPTEGVRQMMRDLAILPVWYAKSGSKVIASVKDNQEYVLGMGNVFDMYFDVTDLSDLKKNDFQERINVWGWNHSICSMLRRAGVPAKCLPTDQELTQRRHLSQRKMVAAMLERFEGQEGFCGISHNVADIVDCEQYFNSLKDKGGMVVKQPWSSSGKGLLWCRDDFNDRDRNWCQRVILDQGYVAVSPIYNNVHDFAMEFFVGDEPNRAASFFGYSLFDTDARGQYRGNALMSNEAIEYRLTKYVPKERLERTRQVVADFLVANGYQGHVGVDMMVCHEQEGIRIHPCVEINYRRTMGMLARNLSDSYLSLETQGRFMIQHFNTHTDLLDFVVTHERRSPLLVIDGVVKRGFMPLVPIMPTTLNLAYIEVK
ncbi:MAG: hypothetical protein IJ534_01820 [Bacteroidaceae bacterium]|nr:hypothetical protein [Bacteroidaceae bacterium]